MLGLRSEDCVLGCTRYRASLDTEVVDRRLTANMDQDDDSNVDMSIVS